MQKQFNRGNSLLTNAVGATGYPQVKKINKL
jgi:hypothetical protein